MTNVTSGLTAKKPGSAPCPTLVIEYGTTFLTFILRLPQLRLSVGERGQLRDPTCRTFYAVPTLEDNSYSLPYNKKFYISCITLLCSTLV